MPESQKKEKTGTPSFFIYLLAKTYSGMTSITLNLQVIYNISISLFEFIRCCDNRHPSILLTNTITLP